MTVHTNIILKLCADAGDLDNMWGIAGRLEEKGPNVADKRTYDIVLSAELRNAVENAPEDASNEDLAKHYEKSVLLARRIWIDVIRRWAAGHISMDESLVGVMGRILLLSYRPRDWDDVLSLVEQTQQVPRMTGILGTSKRERAEHWAESSTPTLDTAPEDMIADANDRSLSLRGSEFVGIPETVAKTSKHHVKFVAPGRGTLSLLLQTSLKLHSKKAADDYWTLLTETYKVKPDYENYKSYLRVLRLFNSSARTVQLVRQAAESLRLGQDIFIIAMSACTRDKNNIKSFDHATELMHTMSKHLKKLPLNVVLKYLLHATGTRDVERIERAVFVVDDLAQSSPDTPMRVLVHGATSEKASMDDKTLKQVWEVCTSMMHCLDRLFQMNPKSPNYDKWERLRRKYKQWARELQSAHRGTLLPKSQPAPRYSTT